MALKPLPLTAVQKRRVLLGMYLMAGSGLIFLILGLATGNSIELVLAAAMLLVSAFELWIWRRAPLRPDSH